MVQISSSLKPIICSVCLHYLSSAFHHLAVCVCLSSRPACACLPSSVPLCVSPLVCTSVATLCFSLHVCLCLWVCFYVCVCVGQGSRLAAVCRPAVPVNGGTADDTTTADGRGSEVAGTGGKAAGNTHSAYIGKC